MRVLSEKGRQRLSEKMKAQNATHDFSAAISQTMREKWADPQYREERAKAIYGTQPDNAVKLPPDTSKP